jgi:nucleotide-binding universal stress UspA family protein
MRRFMTVGRRTVDVHAELLRHRSERLRVLAENTRAGDGTEVKVLSGEPFIEVIRHVLEHDNDLVIVGGREVANWALPELPSGVMHLLRKCPAPVWVMRPPRSDELRILALIDPDPDDPVRDGLNDLVLSLATSLARREDGKLDVGHAWELAGESTLRSSPYVCLPDEVVDVLAETAEGVHREQLGALLARHHAAEAGAEVHLVPGHAGEVLPKLADGLRAGLIVMGTVARTGISGLIIGNTAETILQSVHCSVLAVKPEGFVTPVKPAEEKVVSCR